MEYLEIDGRASLSGKVRLCGAKNSILPMLAASLLTEGTSVFRDVPMLTDVALACAILSELGSSYRWQGNALTVNSLSLSKNDIPREMMEGMRGSFIFLGALLARRGEAELYMPGGCKLGLRPVDIHIDALRAMGAQFKTEENRVIASVPAGRLAGAEITLRFPSVGATENILLAAATAHGVTVIRHAAREPEIVDLARYLNCCGADITGAGSHTVTIRGVEWLHGCDFTVTPDRILAASLMSAAAVTGSGFVIENVAAKDIRAILDVYSACGLRIVEMGDALAVDGSGPVGGCRRVVCVPYPGFPTDVGPLLAATLCFGTGTSEIYDSVFENRFQCCAEFIKFGADASVVGRSAILHKKCRPFTAAHVTARDLRGGMALACMALGSEGTSLLFGVEHIDRGYQALEATLSSLGARVRRIKI